MSALAPSHLDVTTLARLGVLQGTGALLPARAVLGLGWPELERALPDRGLPRGVVELAALPRLHGKASRASSQRCPESMRGGATTIALSAVCAVHAADERAWCAWITPAHGGGRACEPLEERAKRAREAPLEERAKRAREPYDVPSLYAPALVQAGVDLARLLVVRPSPQALARAAVKVAASGAFALVVVDVPHRNDLGGARSSSASARRGDVHDAGVHDAGAVVVRKLALAAEENGTTTLLLTSALAPRPVPWPVAMRVEVERRPEALSLRVTKDRRGAGSSAHVVPLLDPTTDPALARADADTFARAG
ncbi:MAG: hypothetical protein KF782_20820 [Labilithrix sp.]|nr:hypothetical protein [Labilithrix sp.]